MDRITLQNGEAISYNRGSALQLGGIAKRHVFFIVFTERSTWKSPSFGSLLALHQLRCYKCQTFTNCLSRHRHVRQDGICYNMFSAARDPRDLSLPCIFTLLYSSQTENVLFVTDTDTVLSSEPMKMLNEMISKGQEMYSCGSCHLNKI